MDYDVDEWTEIAEELIRKLQAGIRDLKSSGMAPSPVAIRGDRTAVARELVTIAKELVAEQTVFRAGVLNVTTSVYGISCVVNGDPKMKKRDFVGKYYKKVSGLMDDFDRERHIIGTINFKKAQGSLDYAFREWVTKAIESGRWGDRISAKTMDGIDMDDGGDDFGKMWDIEDKAMKAGYVLENGYYVKA